MRSGWGLVLAMAFGVAAACSATQSAQNAGTGGAAGAANDASSDGNAGAAGAPADAGDDAVKPAKTEVVIGPGADQSAPTKFGGPDDPYAKISLVYPADGVLVPPNMNALEVHFTPPSGEDLFEISFVSPALALVVYTSCTHVGAGCVYTTDKTFWNDFVGANRGTPPISYHIRGVSSASPLGVGSSESRSMAFSKEDIVGGLYYWNTTGVIQRYDFGLPLQKAEQYMTPQMAGALTCVGCHGLSRDGKRMAIGQDIPAPAPYKIYDVATRTPLQNGDAGVIGGGGNFFSFDPNGTKLLVSDGVKIGLQDVATGNLDDPALIPSGAMPDWSPDGSLIVYAKPTQAPPFGFAQPGVLASSLEIVLYDNGKVSPPSTLVAFAGQNNYYPAFAPTQKWVAYNRSPANMDSYSAGPPKGDGELWAASVDKGTSIRLDAANTGGSCSWPKWAPVVATYWGGPVMFLTVSSARAYGLRLVTGQQVQLWMTAFDPKRAEQGKDPSFPALWFPFQDLGGGNHIAQWVAKIERQPCITNADCKGDETCDNGLCIPVIK